MNTSKKPKIYLAGPFFNPAELKDNQLARVILRNKGLDVFVPQEHKIPDGENMSNILWSKKVYEMDRDAILKCDIIVCIYYGLYSDSGTAWEIGFAKCLGKKIVVVHTNSQLASLMISSCADYNLNSFKDLEDFDFYDLNKNINKIEIEQK